MCDGKYNGLTFTEMYEIMLSAKEHLPKEMVDIIFEYMEPNMVLGYYVCQSCIDNPHVSNMLQTRLIIEKYEKRGFSNILEKYEQRRFSNIPNKYPVIKYEQN